MTDTTDPQAAVFEFLADPATHGGQPVKRIDTHAASVFLAGERVLKVKRAVRFPFLDYSTLDKRKEACAAELSVNAPYAPDIYRGVVPITREASGRLTVGGDGPPVEWAVEMRRFDEKRTLDHVAGEIDAALADSLGRAVAAAHGKARVAAADRWIAALGTYIDEHVDAFRQHPDIFPAGTIEAFERATRTAYDKIVPLLQQRARDGFVRRIHGDLHLGNIVLIDGEPVLFDAIEFSDIIATGDVFYDLGFLLMDLLQRGLKPAANIVLNRYLLETRRIENLDALELLPFFLSTRAAIRAKVTAARLERAQQSERKAIADTARAYFDFAVKAVAPPPPALVALGGLSGSGKSALARMLASEIGPMPGAVVLRSDIERKALFGVGELDRLPASAYTEETTARVYAALGEQGRRAVAAGHGAVVDAVFARPSERAAVASVAEAAKTPFQGLFLTADLETRMRRVGARTGDASDADAALARRQQGYELGPMDWPMVDASGTPETTLLRAKAALKLS
jgi:aminoglycoside phosphotransferase family enzyme/predicted kinase